LIGTVEPLTSSGLLAKILKNFSNCRPEVRVELREAFSVEQHRLIAARELLTLLVRGLLSNILIKLHPAGDTESSKWMAWQDSFSLHFLSACHCRVEVSSSNHRKHAVAVWLQIWMANRTAMVLHVPFVHWRPVCPAKPVVHIQGRRVRSHNRGGVDKPFPLRNHLTVFDSADDFDFRA
jgi:hypothetical protein